MKIVFISNIFPTPDNYKAASALSYHLLKYRPNDVEVIGYSFNANHVPNGIRNQVEKDLNLNIKLLRSSRFMKWFFRLHLTFLKNFLPYPFGYYNQLSKKIVKEINALQPDGIWVNGDCLSVALKQLDGFKSVMTMPDCVPLYYHRLMGDKYLWNSWIQLIGNCDQYYKNLRMEREYPVGEYITYHLVGEQDRLFFQKINPKANAVFIRHPHYNFQADKIIKFSRPKINLLIAGQYNLYMKTSFDELLPKLCAEKDLTSHYTITFLGKGWDFAVEQLQNSGFTVRKLGYVDVYLEEISKYDIQLIPISVGTGTKGKVLDALANGLLVIGTPYAVENVAISHNESCIVYNDVTTLLNILRDIPANREHYENIAEAGRHNVLTFHDRTKVSSQLFSLFTK